MTFVILSLTPGKQGGDMCLYMASTHSIALLSWSLFLGLKFLSGEFLDMIIYWKVWEARRGCYFAAIRYRGVKGGEKCFVTDATV